MDMWGGRALIANQRSGYIPPSPAGTRRMCVRTMINIQNSDRVDRGQWKYLYTPNNYYYVQRTIIIAVVIIDSCMYGGSGDNYQFSIVLVTAYNI